ncbi:MAG TPA: hypothetical protein VG917_04445 [Patescibacteria group bacterium]|nr:hypothetical protein [Patescibacteria group bacterium]
MGFIEDLRKIKAAREAEMTAGVVKVAESVVGEQIEKQGAEVEMHKARVFLNEQIGVESILAAINEELLEGQGKIDSSDGVVEGEFGMGGGDDYIKTGYYSTGVAASYLEWASGNHVRRFIVGLAGGLKVMYDQSYLDGGKNETIAEQVERYTGTAIPVREVGGSLTTDMNQLQKNILDVAKRIEPFRGQSRFPQLRF